jgi:hypothetical protein
MVAGLMVLSIILAVVAWKSSGGEDAFLSGLFKFISVVFFLLAAVSVASMVIIGKSSHAQLDKRKSANRWSEPPPEPVGGEAAVDDRFDFGEPEVVEQPSAPRPAPKKPRPAPKRPTPTAPPASQKKPRPVRKSTED